MGSRKGVRALRIRKCHHPSDIPTHNLSMTFYSYHVLIISSFKINYRYQILLFLFVFCETYGVVTILDMNIVL